jgi:peptidoglycan/LPS O-acetylase OafA/YrhL
MGSIRSFARAHIHGIDGLRALAAFAVVAHHVGFDTGTTTHSRFGIILEQLDIGVAVFFVLSGFLLGAPFVQRILSDRPIDGIGRFWLRRAVRIYPAYWLVLTFMVLFLGTSIASLYQFVAYYGLLQIYDADLFFGGMVQAWTLCTELAFYAVLPLLAISANFAVRRLTRLRADTALLVGCAALYLASTAWRLAMYGFHPSFGRVALMWLPGQLDLFALGLGLAVLRARTDRDERFNQRVQAFVRSPALWWAAAVVVFAFTCFAGLRRPIVPADTPFSFGDGTEFWRQIAFGLFSILLIAPIALRRRPDRLTSATLGSRPMVMLGVVSYGVYLWHKSLIPKVQEWFGWGFFQGNFLVVFLAVALLSTALAWLTHRWIESPSLRLTDGGGIRSKVPERETAIPPDTDPGPSKD